MTAVQTSLLLTQINSEQVWHTLERYDMLHMKCVMLVANGQHLQGCQAVQVVRKTSQPVVVETKHLQVDHP